MTAFTITVDDKAVQDELTRLQEKIGNLAPVLRLIGDQIVERTKRRFETSTGPDGSPWAPNSAATLELLANSLGKNHRKKGGDLNAKGSRILANKKPLIGETRDLSRQFVTSVQANSLTITSTPRYAAIQQFGGKAGRGRKVTIPARPFLPIHQDGTLYPDDQSMILDMIDQYLLDRQ